LQLEFVFFSGLKILAKKADRIMLVKLTCMWKKGCREIAFFLVMCFILLETVIALFYNKILSPKKLLEICLFITSTLKVDFSFSFLFFDSFLKAKFSETNFVS